MNPRGELRGVRVLDAATLYPAPLLAAMLGDLGADVVKLEPPDGDPLRAFGPTPWAVAGRNKRSVVVDVDDAHEDNGLRLLSRLTGAADVIVFNQPAEVLRRWQCADDELAERNPSAVVVHVSCFGTTGPMADRVGNGTLAEAFVGLPAETGVPLGDTVGALHGVSRVVAALFARERAADRRGSVVDVALYEALLPLVATRGADTSRMVRRRFAGFDGREVAISATTSAQLRRLEELAGDDVAQWIASRTSATAVEELAAVRVPAVIVNEFEREPPSDAPAPALGEHTAEVVEEWLGGP